MYDMLSNNGAVIHLTLPNKSLGSDTKFCSEWMNVTREDYGYLDTESVWF